jgi:hypothetical protein
MSDCQHEDFVANVIVNRITSVEDGPTTSYQAEVKIECLACHEPFVFVGLPTGMSPRQPCVSIDWTELRCPVRPESAPEGWGEAGPGFSVQN